MKTAIKTFALFIISLLMVLVAAEVVYRYYLTSRGIVYIRAGIESDVYHHDLKPNFSGDQQYYTERTHYVTNNLGFRDRENRVVSPQHTRYRLVFIGDSFTEGVGVDYDKTFVGLIQKSLPEIDVLNAGVTSYAPILENVKIRSKILPLKPDQIVMMVDPSDAQDSIVYHDWLVNSEEHREPFIKRLIRKSVFLSAMVTKLAPVYLPERYILPPRHGKVWTTFFYERTRWLTDKATMDDWGRKGYALLLKDIGETIRICRSYRIKLTIVIYPWPKNISDRKYLIDYRGGIRKLCHDNQVDFIDLFDDFNPSMLPTHFIRSDPHWNAAGHSFVAQMLLSRLHLPSRVSHGGSTEGSAF